MSVDELLELLEKRDARLSWTSTDAAKLARIAELETENKRLKHELEQHLLQLKALQELIVIKF